MKRLFLAATIAVAALSTPATAQVSINIGQPGFYGRIDIGGFPPPPLLYPEPRIIHRAPRAYPPIYLRVPPGHARSWHRYCGRYNACGRPVYFVQDDWYRHEYAPRYQERHSYRGNDGYRGYDRRDDRHEYRDDRRDDHRGRGRGRGHDDEHRHGHGRDH